MFTHFEIWLIENVIKPTYQNEEKPNERNHSLTSWQNVV